MVGDRLVDVAYNLGVVPAAMSVRCSMWPLCSKLKSAVTVLGCPNCVTKKDKTIVPKYIEEHDIKRVIVEKHPAFCLYLPNLQPVDVVPLLEGTGVTIEYVDFSKGLESAIRRTALLLGLDEKAEALIERYRKELAETMQALPARKSDKRVVILSGVYQGKTGKAFLRVEMLGGYSDRFLLGSPRLRQCRRRPEKSLDQGKQGPFHPQKTNGPGASEARCHHHYRGYLRGAEGPLRTGEKISGAGRGAGHKEHGRLQPAPLRGFERARISRGIAAVGRGSR